MVLGCAGGFRFLGRSQLRASLVACCCGIGSAAATDLPSAPGVDVAALAAPVQPVLSAAQRASPGAGIGLRYDDNGSEVMPGAAADGQLLVDATFIGPLALAGGPVEVSREDLARRAKRVLEDEACYGGDAWRPRPADSADPEAMRIRGLKSWESFRDCSGCPEMKVIPAGEFEMGSAPRADGRKSDEEPRHLVAIRSFAVARYELEWSSFERFVKATKRSAGESCLALNEGNANWDAWTDLSWAVPGYAQAPNHPAVCVSWQDAQDYVRWLSSQTGKRYRLLSEAEWEYAARAQHTGQVYWSDRGRDTACIFGNVADQTTSGESAWVERFSCTDGWWLPAPVGTYRPNAFGLYDMLGNVWEWVEDCSSPDYESASGDGRPRTCGQCERRIMRGASWGTRPSAVRFGNRARAPIDRRSVTIGFRVARDLE